MTLTCEGSLGPGQGTNPRAVYGGQGGGGACGAMSWNVEVPHFKETYLDVTFEILMQIQ